MSGAEAARKRAERCFAVARSTSFEGERAAAIAMGSRIAEKAGLSLDLFDVPGRPRPSAQARTAAAAQARHAKPTTEIPEALRALYAEMRRAAERVGAAADETVYAARRRNFDEAAASAKERDFEHAHRLQVDVATSVLWNAGMRCHPASADRKSWLIEVDGRLCRVGAGLLVHLARLVVDYADDDIVGIFQTGVAAG